MAFTGLEPGVVYWARSREAKDGPLTVVQVSTLFGENREYWTLVVPGSDQHHMPGDFDILEKIASPSLSRPMRQAAE